MGNHRDSTDRGTQFPFPHRSHLMRNLTILVGVGTQIAATDVTGDGLPDVVVGNKAGTFVYVHRSTPVTAAQYRGTVPRKISARAN